MSEQDVDTTRGGYFVIPSGLGFPVNEKIFIPESFSEEQRMIQTMTKEFVENEVLPNIEAIDAKEDNFAITLELLKKAAELGLLGIDIEEKYGGAGLDLPTLVFASDGIGAAGSWAVSWAANVGIATHPLLLFGTEEQKSKYLPKLTSGEWLAAFAATEAEAGSNLFAIKTKAVLDADGKNYILNGEKTFITNAGFANLFTVLAVVDGDRKKSACFLVERDTPGFAIGKEEHKMGITGSSTCPMNFDNVKVPKKNLLLDIGSGIYIILNTLNIGRLKLGALTTATNKHLITQSIQYALERKQFGFRIADFGLIKEKLARMIVKTWMTESAVYRTTHLIENKLSHIDNPKDVLNALRDYEVECALLKVAGSENLSFVADENVQIHGGYGYIKEFSAWRFYVDAKINEIFEGTNEINRLAAIGALLRKAGANEIPLIQAGLTLANQLEEIQSDELSDKPLAREEYLINNAKKMFLFAAGLVYQKFGHDKVKLIGQQELLGRLFDMLLRIYPAESGLLRAQEIGGEIPEAIVSIDAQDMILEIETLTKEILVSLDQGDMLKSYLSRIKRLTRYDLVNTIALQRKLVDRLIKEGKYFL